MNTRFSKQRSQALTRLDVLVVVLMVIILFAALMSIQRTGKERAKRIGCINNLKQINLALRTWETGGGPKTNSTVESIPSGLNSGQKAWVGEIGFSNVLRSWKILRCPADGEEAPTNVSGFNVRISYFLNLDTSETYPNVILSSDDDLAISNIPVKPGILEIINNTPVTWTGVRHGKVYCVSFADGSVAGESGAGLMSAVPPMTTNHWAIP